MVRLRFLSCALGFLLIHSITSCGPIPMTAGALGRVEEASRMRKAASLKAWEANGNNRGSTIKMAEIRTGLLLRWDSVNVSSERTAQGGLHWSLELRGNQGSIASAVPISADGYFLTAGHCVGEPSATLVGLTKQVHMEKGAVRVVWRGQGAEDSPDLAVIHVSMKPAVPFRLANPNRLQSGSSVAITGWSGLGRSHVTGSSAGGRLLDVSPLQRGRAGVMWRWVRHDVPLGAGDSGGPLITDDGRCAGINSKMVVSGLTVLKAWSGLTGSSDQPMKDYYGEAILPDEAWLQGVIDADRRSH